VIDEKTLLALTAIAANNQRQKLFVFELMPSKHSSAQPAAVPPCARVALAPARVGFGLPERGGVVMPMVVEVEGGGGGGERRWRWK